MIRSKMRRAVFAFLCFVAVPAIVDPARAADLPKGMNLVPAHPLYFVTRDAFIRDLPDNSAKRIGQILKGQRLTVAGKVAAPKSKGPAWLALKRPDGTIGYVFGAALLPMIDGTLKAPLQGKLYARDRPECRYVIAFEGRTQVADDIQQTADYDIAFECTGKDEDNPLTFNAGMFITELPFEENREVYQINIDLWDMRVNEEDVLSVTALYDPMAKRVSFDRVNDDTLADGGGLSDDAADVPAALATAVKIAYRAWQAGVWDHLAHLPKPDSDVYPDARPGDVPNDSSGDDERP